MIKFSFNVVILYLCTYLTLAATETIEETFYPDLEVIEMRLGNGMRVCFKPTNFDSDEILIRLTSPEGFSLFSENSRASAELAAKVALESGLGDLSSDNLSTFLYNKAIEFSMQTKAFSQGMDGICPKEELSALFLLINHAFTKAHFTLQAYEEVLKHEQNTVARRKLDFDSTFEEAFLALNTQNLPILKSLSLEDLKKTQFDKAKDFYEKVFINPSSYICVIVGNLNKEEVKKQVMTYLAPIPAVPFSYHLERSVVEFPPGITKKHIVSHKKGEGMARLTFPILKPLGENTIHSLELACQLVEGRLRKVISEQFQTTQAVDVAYEIPLFPSLELAWITVQYRGSAERVSPIAKMILAELNHLKKEGPDREAFEAALLQQAQSDSYWLRDNDYWLSTLTNYYMLNWNPRIIKKSLATQPSFESIKEVVTTFFSTTNYTMISSQPAR